MRRLVVLGFGLVLVAAAILVLYAKQQPGKRVAAGGLKWRGQHALVVQARDGRLRISRRKKAKTFGIRSTWTTTGETVVEMRGKLRNRSPSPRAGRLKVVVKLRTRNGRSTKRTVRAGKKWRSFRVARVPTGGQVQGEIVVKARSRKDSRFAISDLRLEPVGGDSTGGGGPVPSGTGPTVSQMATVTDHEPHVLSVSGSPYRYIIIRDQLRTQLPQIRARNPNTTVFVYKNLSFVLEEPGCPWWPYQGGGVDWCQANAHPDWFLHDRSGKRINSDAYPFQWAMNIAHSGYRQQWISNVLSRLQTEEYDGVFIDDTNLYPGHGMDGRIAELTDAQYRQATVEFIDQISRSLHQHGYQVMPNVALDLWKSAQSSAAMQIADDVDVFNREYLVRWSSGGVFTGDGYMGHLSFAEKVMKAGNAYNGMIYGGPNETQVMRYGRATFLLAWDGKTPSSLTYRTPAGNSYFPDWTTEIGEPTSARFNVGKSLRRNYSNGTVVLNHGDSGRQTLNLGGFYRRPDGSCINQVTLSSGRALVMPSC